MRARLQEMFGDEPPERQAEMRPRMKERTIRNVMQLVWQWVQVLEMEYGRRLDQQTKNAGLDLDEASRFIGMPKKTMIDYLLRLRHAEKLGFNFDANLNKGMGILRLFNRVRY